MSDTGGGGCFGVCSDGSSEQYPSLLPSLYLRGLSRVSRPFSSLGAIWLAFETLANTKILAINGEKHIYFPASSNGALSSAPLGLWPANSGRVEGRTHSQSPSWHKGSRNISPAMNVNKFIPDCLDP